MRTKRFWMPIILALPLAMSMSSVSLAAEDEAPETEETTTEELAETLEVVLSFMYDTAKQVLTVAITSPEYGEIDCVAGEEDCPLTELAIAGEAEQVNHGQIISAFAELVKDGELDVNAGCLISAMANSSLGQGDQQVKPGDEAIIGEPSGLESMILTCHAANAEKIRDKVMEQLRDRTRDGEDEDGNPDAKQDREGRPENPGKAFGLSHKEN